MIDHPTSLRRQAGTAAVETALMLPFLVFLMLAIAEIGQAALHYNELTKTTRDAARHLAAHALAGSTEVIEIDAALAQDTANVAVYGNTVGSGNPVVAGLSTSDVDVIALDDVHVRVDIRFRYNPLLGLDDLPTFGLVKKPIDVAVPLHTSVVMRAM